MGGLKNLFLKLTPIMFLICCICYGILHTFQQQGEANITYLTQESINIGTEENPDYKTLWKFDMVSYTQNIDQDILKRSINKTINFETYDFTLTQFNNIWDDGYQIFDVSKTIANAIVLTINTLILPINILLVPIRIISGILLTGMSLIGININNGTIITPMLKFFVDKLAIPFIYPQNAKNYQFYENINEHYTGNQTIYIEFENENLRYQYFDAIIIEQYEGSHVKLKYRIKDTNNTYTVFDSGRTGNAWAGAYNQASKIKIATLEGKTAEERQIIKTFLTNYGLWIAE